MIPVMFLKLGFLFLFKIKAAIAIITSDIGDIKCDKVTDLLAK